MPLIVWIIVRIVRAFGETAVLLSDRRTLRRLPWPYIRAIPRRDKLGAVAVGALAVSTVCLLIGLVVKPILAIGILAAVIGLLASWQAGKQLKAV
jgi:hypothetical protein